LEGEMRDSDCYVVLNPYYYLLQMCTKFKGGIMRKKTFLRAVALLACVAILSLSVPNTFAVDKAQKGFDLKLLLKKPAQIIYAIFPFLALSMDAGQNTSPDNKPVKNNSISSTKAKITGTLNSVKPPIGD